MEKIKSFYKNKKVLVTGVTGFKGSWLCSWLLLLGAKVYGTGFNPNQNKNLFHDDDLWLALYLYFVNLLKTNFADSISSLTELPGVNTLSIISTSPIKDKLSILYLIFLLFLIAFAIIKEFIFWNT